MTHRPRLRIGTRGSPLALAQTRQACNKLSAAHSELAAEGAIETVVIKTTGDKVLDRALSEVGGKGLFTKEIDTAMLEGRIDMAVHSMKDVPTFLPDGIILPCMLEREDPRDVFISNKAASLSKLPNGAVVGTASLRRQAQILAKYPHLKVVTFRGNVQTRLKKLKDNEVDATLLALAGLNRLGMAEAATEIIDTDEILPAVGQGAVGIACRSEDERSRAWLAPLNHESTVQQVSAERAFLRVLDGSCRTPIAALAKVQADGVLFLQGLVAQPDGAKIIETFRQGLPQEASAIGQDAGWEVKNRAGPDFFATFAKKPEETL